jgi:hypothetical protein
MPPRRLRHRLPARRVLAVGLLACLLPLGRAQAQTASQPGEPLSPEPTLQHLSLVWPFGGDSNGNARVAVRYRPLGAPTWREAMPLFRVPAASAAGVSWGARHAGSLFGLSPGQAYEIELRLDDPDGGASLRTLQASTRAAPALSAGTRKPATPASLASVLAGAQPGDVIELGAGDYAGFSLARDGSAVAPLTLLGLPGARIIGELSLFGRQHVQLRNLAINGRLRLNGSQDIAVIGNRVSARSQNAGDGIVCFTRCARLHIEGNTVEGLTVWREAAFGASGDNLGEGIAVTGPGHVIVGNTVRGFRDGISFLEEAEAVDQFSIDVLDNTIGESADDGVEADFCAHNCRIVGNRLTNSFIAFSSQPGLGGPTWFVRNEAYNVVHVPFKLYRGSRGDVLLHNTVVKHGDGLNAYPGMAINALYARNNLFLGGPAGTFNGFSSGSGRVADLADLVTTTSSLDYNGYGTSLAEFRGRLGAVSFTGLAQLRSLTSELHGLQVDYSVFAGNVAFPATPTQVLAHPALDLAPSAVAVDAGLVLPGINDGFSGAAPDLGARERPPASDPARIFGNGFEPLP